MDKIKIALVGCGNISQLNAPGYLQHPQCEVYALCDTMAERAATRARQWGIAPKIYTDYAQVLNDPHVDAIELLTPTPLHAEQIIAAVNAGKHVSCQKPLCATVAEADEILGVVSRAATICRVTENFLYYPPILKAKELLDAGVIGEPSLVRLHTTRVPRITNAAIALEADAAVWRRDAARNPGGVLYDDGVHKYAVAMKWIGEIDKIQAIVLKTADFVTEAPATAIWKFKDRHCLGMLDYSYAPGLTIRGKYYGVDEFFEIHGSHGIIWVTRCSGEMLDLSPVMVFKGAETISYQVPMDWQEGFDGAARDFVDSLIQGRQPELDVQTSKQICRWPWRCMKRPVLSSLWPHTR